MAQRQRRRTSLSRCSLSIALLGALSAPAFANGGAAGSPTTLDKVVVTAAGFEQKITDAPASICVVSRE
jgi:outer membrane receptor for ferrienterochelin and colicins